MTSKNVLSKSKGNTNVGEKDIRKWRDMISKVETRGHDGKGIRTSFSKRELGINPLRALGFAET